MRTTRSGRMTVRLNTFRFMPVHGSWRRPTTSTADLPDHLTPNQGWRPPLAPQFRHRDPAEAVRALAVASVEAVGSGMDSAVAALVAVKLVHDCPSDGLARNGCSACRALVQ